MKNFKKSFLLLKNSPGKLAAAVFIDFIFYISSLFIGFYFFSKFFEKYNMIANSLQSMTGGVDESVVLELNIISDALKNIIFIILIFFIALFVLWSIFKSFIWLLSKNIIKEEKFFNGLSLDYFLDFSLLTLLWFLIGGIFIFLFYNYPSYFLEKGIVSILVMNIPLIVLIYFGSISFSLFSLRFKVMNSFGKSFLFGIKKIRLLLPFAVAFVLIYFIESLLIYLLRLYGFALFSFIGAAAFILILAWFRVYLLLEVKECAGDRI